MNLQPRLKSQRTAHLLFGKPSTSVSFERDALLGRASQVPAVSNHGPHYIFRQFDVHLHAVLIDIIAYDGR